MEVELYVNTFQLFSVPQSKELRNHTLQYGASVYVAPSFKIIIDTGSKPILKLRSIRNQKILYCTVAGLTAPENTIIGADILLDYFEIDEGEQIEVYTGALQPLSFVCLQMPPYFHRTEIPKRKVIDDSLKQFDCLVRNQIVNIFYKDAFHAFRVKSTEPFNAGLLLKNEYMYDVIPAPEVSFRGFMPFSGKGYTLSGKVIERIPLRTKKRREDRELAMMKRLQSVPFSPFCGKAYKLTENEESEPEDIHFIDYMYVDQEHGVVNVENSDGCTNAEPTTNDNVDDTACAGQSASDNAPTKTDTTLVVNKVNYGKSLKKTIVFGVGSILVLGSLRYIIRHYFPSKP